MNKIIKLLGLAFLAMSFCYGQNDYYQAEKISKNGNDIISVNINKVKSEIVDYPLSKIISNCEVIKLEVTDKSMYKSLWRVSISDNYILGYSERKPVMLFNRKGKFLRNIGAIGKGPGEYTSLYGLQIDEKAKRIYLNPGPHEQKILSYDLEGTILEPIPLLYRLTKSIVYVDKNIVTVLSMPLDDSLPPAYQQTLDGKLIQKMPSLNHLILTYKSFDSEMSSTRNTGNFDSYIVDAMNKQVDTLFHYNASKNNFIPKFVAKASDEEPDMWYREFNKHFIVSIFSKDFKGDKVIVDKNTLQASFFRLIDDFHGGIELKRFFLRNNGMFIGSIDPTTLTESIKAKLSDSKTTSGEKNKLNDLLKTFDLEDNELLFIGKMK